MLLKLGFICELCGTKKTTKDQTIIHYITRHLGVSLKGRRPTPGERAQGEQHVIMI
jgi:hypothetical protein